MTDTIDAPRVAPARAVLTRGVDPDQVVVSPAGIWIVQAAAVAPGSRVSVQRTGGYHVDALERLLVEGVDRGDLLTGPVEQADLVRAVLGAAGGFDDVAVRPVLALAGGRFPRFARLHAHGVRVVSPRQADRLLGEPGPIDADRQVRLRRRLITQLPPR